MKRTTIKLIVIFSLAVFLGGLLFSTSQNVQKSEDDLKAIHAQIEAEKETIGVLEVEWGYLNRPQRLEELAKRALKMKVPKSEEITGDLDDLSGAPLQEPVSMIIPQAKPASLQRGGGQ